MAISPTIRQHMQQPQDSAPSQQTFEHKFGEAAYNALRAKFPSLLEYIVTFKVIDSDLETGTGLGAFIVAQGKDVVYVPVVLANGSVDSCEMLYDKAEDTFVPLSEAAVKKVVGQNSLTDFELVKKPPYVEDTRELFKRLTLPPDSSHRVYGGESSGVASLPNATKEKIASYFKSNPALLGAVSEFYPVGQLAEKLAAVPENIPVVPENIPAVLSIDELTKKTAATLSAMQKQSLLQDGYVICKQAEADVQVVGTVNLARNLINNMGLTEYNGQDLIGTGFVFYMGDNEVKGKKCLVAGKNVFSPTGRKTVGHGESLVVGNFSDGITAADLLEFNAVSIDSVAGSKKDLDNPRVLHIFYPMKNGRYKLHDMSFSGDIERENIDGTIVLKSERSQAPRATFSGTVSSGCVEMDGGSCMFPKDSYALTTKYDSTPLISSLQSLYKLIEVSAPKLKIIDNGAGITLKDSSSTKTANFRKTADLVDHLVVHYGFDKQAVDKLMEDKEVLVLTKQAFIQPSETESPYNNEEVPDGSDHFNPEIIESSASLGDAEILDTGILASVASDEDIKVMLVDLLPDFINTVSKLGQTILLSSMNKEDLEDFYSQEEYQGLMGNLRKVFKTLGDIVHDLRKYINMN